MAEKHNASPAAEQAIDLAEVQKQIAAMLDAAREEARKIVDNAKAAAAEIVAPAKEKSASDEEKAARKAYMEELVEVKLFRDTGKYKDDVFVAVNGENCVIKRGERVKIKRKFAEVLDNSDRQDYETSKLIEAKSREFAESGL